MEFKIQAVIHAQVCRDLLEIAHRDLWEAHARVEDHECWVEF